MQLRFLSVSLFEQASVCSSINFDFSRYSRSRGIVAPHLTINLDLWNLEGGVTLREGVARPRPTRGFFFPPPWEKFFPSISLNIECLPRGRAWNSIEERSWMLEKFIEGERNSSNDWKIYFAVDFFSLKNLSLYWIYMKSNCRSSNNRKENLISAMARVNR